MTPLDTPATLTAVEAEVHKLMKDAGFQLVEPGSARNWKARVANIYEDAYSIVCIAIYETWTHLHFAWTDDQANLVDLISEYFTRVDAKASEGYLVLLTPSVVPQADRSAANGIKNDISRVRKLLADGLELKTAGGVRRTLFPVLPLNELGMIEDQDVLEALPSLLAKYDVGADATNAAIKAFRGRHPIVERIHSGTAHAQEEQQQ